MLDISPSHFILFEGGYINLQYACAGLGLSFQEVTAPARIVPLYKALVDSLELTCTFSLIKIGEDKMTWIRPLAFLVLVTHIVQSSTESWDSMRMMELTRLLTELHHKDMEDLHSI